MRTGIRTSGQSAAPGFPTRLRRWLLLLGIQVFPLVDRGVWDNRLLQQALFGVQHGSTGTVRYHPPEVLMVEAAESRWESTKGRGRGNLENRKKVASEVRPRGR